MSFLHACTQVPPDGVRHHLRTLVKEQAVPGLRAAGPKGLLGKARCEHARRQVTWCCGRGRCCHHERRYLHVRASPGHGAKTCKSRRWQLWRMQQCSFVKLAWLAWFERVVTGACAAEFSRLACPPKLQLNGIPPAASVVALLELGCRQQAASSCGLPECARRLDR